MDPEPSATSDHPPSAEADTNGMGEPPAITVDLTDLSCPDPLEKIFQQVEEQNERRAQQEAEDKDSVPTTLPRVESSENLKKGRRRGSISITRFGQLSTSDATSDGSSTGPMTPALSDIAAKSPFFQQQLKNGSQTSFASGGSAADDADAHHEDDHHVTHMHTIAPKQSLSRAMGGFLPRRLSRARSTGGILPGADNMVIGVSVAAATVELPEGGEGEGAAPGAVVHAPGALHHQTSKGSIGGASLSNKMGWAARAKNFTKKFRRKSKMPLAPGEEAAAS
ncbi:hypothetical protein MVEN_00970200 [Mycena venus]|uniref:Uncharacterized protein n=1 Tax=Mycena venus TaxID=2733690 RepID=A0A8H6YAW5_9AGAR|nr:hypothetical protein MVEN_00970200 [Mycena venus]